MSELVQTPTGEHDSPFEDLIVSILSVNQYPLEETYEVLSLLREGGLLSPENLIKWELEEIIARLKSSGCDRGPFMTNLFAVRLSSFGVAVEAHGMEDFKEILLSNDPGAISNLLLPINGIGPKVLRNFFMLRGIKA